MKTPQKHIDAYREFRLKDLEGEEAVRELEVLLQKAEREGLPSWECFLRGRIAFEEERYEEALHLFNEALTHDPNNAFAMVSVGVTLGREGEYDRARTVCDEVITLFGDAEELPLREQVARAMVNKGVALGKLDKLHEEVSAYEDVVSRFGDAEEPALREPVARAMLNNGVVLGSEGEPDRARTVFDEVITLFGDAEEPALRKQVARAMVNKGVALGKLDKPQESVSAYDEVVSLFGDAEEPALREWVARAMLNKGVVLGREGEFGEAREALEKAADIAGDHESIRQKIVLFQGFLLEAEGGVDIPALLDSLLETFPKGKRNKFFQEMKERKSRTQEFLGTVSNFPSDSSLALFFDLREWNSYTPAVPDQHEVDRGGGYYLRYANQGIVVDPGYDFIKNFGAVGGRLCDIDHIVITHAHNDHTQDFESLLSLFHQYNKQHKGQEKRVHLYLSQGVMRKFSGFLPLRGASFLGTIETLNQGNKENPQTILLHGLEGARLTVLRAFHDDALALDYSVGLGFEFDFENDETRTVVFTGDTGIFPPQKEAGDAKRNEAGDPVLDIDLEGKNCLFHAYPEAFQKPDLLIPHIGSIKEEEFKEDHRRRSGGKEDEEKNLYFYPNHLGLRGLALLLHLMRPKVAIISEFGEELKSIRFDLARGTAKLLKKLRKSQPVFVVPGDVTVVYDILNEKFFCHQSKEYCDSSAIEFKEVEETKNSPFYCEGVNRTFFFNKRAPAQKEQKDIIERYCLDIKQHCFVHWLTVNREKD